MSSEPSAPVAGEQAVLRRRRHRVSAVAVAAAVLVAGGGGAWWTSTAGESSGGAPKPPKLALDGLASAEHSGEDPGIAPGEPHPQTYRAAAELPQGPDSAAVYRGPAGISRDSVARLARALSLNGKPEKKGGRWVVGGKDEPALTVNDDRLSGNWTYRSGNWPAKPCGEPLPTVPQQGFAPPGRQAPCPAVPGSGEGDPVSSKTAENAVRPLLRTLKLPDAELDAGVTAGSLRMVTATPEMDGMKAKDWNSTFTVNEDGRVVRGHGNLGALRKGASYPVMSAERTLKHLNRQGPKGAGTVQEPWARDGRAEGAGKPEGARGPGVKGGPRKALKVTGAEFGLVTRYTDGKPVLVPAWTYEVRIRGEHTARIAHPAVKPEYLKPAGAGAGTGPGQAKKPEPAHPAPDPDPGADSGRAEKPGASAVQAATSYETEGRKLKLSFWGGVCSGYEAAAEESGDSVEVRVRQKDEGRGKVCVKMAELQTVEVELERELGGREVVDAADGEALPRK